MILVCFISCLCAQSNKFLRRRTRPKGKDIFLFMISVLFKSIRNSKRRNKGNFTSKSNSNKIKLCGVWGQHYLVLNKFTTL